MAADLKKLAQLELLS